MRLILIALIFISTNFIVGQAYTCERDSNNRTRITKENIPNVYTCYMEMQRGNEVLPRLGTGFLIHPRVVLTAGHNIAWYPTGTVSKVNMYFGSIDSTKYICKDSVKLRKNKNKFYKNNYYIFDNIKRDYGIIILPDSSVYKKVKGYFKVQPIKNLSVDSLTITGAPRDKPKHQIWTETTDNYRQFSNYIKYDLYTVERNSGSPIWYKKEDEYNIIGVHSRKFGKDKACGGAVLITTDVYNQIKEWCDKAGIQI